MKYAFLLILVLLPMMLIPAFADHPPVTIVTADNDLDTPGCIETEVGCYTPSPITVELGTSVIMINNDTLGIHTFTSGTVDGFDATADGIFNSGILQLDDSFEWIADVEGEIPYYDMLHVWMQGVIIVINTAAHIEIELEVDQSQYSYGDVVFVNGTISELDGDEELIISVINPSNIIAYTDTIRINTDLTFDMNFDIEGTVYDEIGTYTVEATYGGNYTSVGFDIQYANTEVITDKSEYYHSEIILVTGHVIQYSDSERLLVLVYNPDGGMAAYDEIVVNTDGTFDFDIIVSDSWVIYGFYTLEVLYATDLSESAETTFELLPNNITIQTDRDTYYLGSIITVNGTMSEFDPNADTIVYCEMYDEYNNMIESLSGDYLQDDGTFLFQISTTDKPEWDKTTEVRMDVTIQGHRSTTSFQYINDVDKSAEANFDRIQIIFQLLNELTDNTTLTPQ